MDIACMSRAIETSSPVISSFATHLETRPPFNAALAGLKSSRAAADVNSGSPVMGWYSWSSAVSFSSISFTYYDADGVLISECAYEES